jgi:hypothetical protein
MRQEAVLFTLSPLVFGSGERKRMPENESNFWYFEQLFGL